MLTGRKILATLIPHSDDMCLLESVCSWDEREIHCQSNTHLNPGNPLRRSGQLSSIHGIEYAAQAAALHGALMMPTHNRPPPPGRLAAVRQITFHTPQLDIFTAPLDILAERMISAGESFIYQFSIYADKQPIISGRISVIAHPGEGALS